MYHYTIKTDKSIPETIQALENSLTNEKFSILWSFNIKDKLNAKGLDYDKNFHILEVCNPFEAHTVLNTNEMVGYFLPCKIVVYEDQGNTNVGMVKPTSMIGILGDANLDSKAFEIEERLIQCMNEVSVD